MKNIFSLIVLLLAGASLFAQRQKADSLIRLLGKETTDTGRIRKMIQIGGALDFGLSKSDTASMYLEEAVNLSKTTGNEQLEVQAAYSLANYLIHSASYPRALILSLENLKKIEKLKREKNIRLTVPNGRDLLFFQTRLLVFIYANIGDYNKQLDYVKRMQAIYNTSLTQEQGANNYVMTIYYNLGNAYSNLKKKDSSAHYRLLLYNEVSASDDPQWIALGTSSLGNYYYDQNNLDTAFQLFRKCIPYAIKSSRTDIVVSSKLHMGSIFHKKNMLDSAFYYLDEALHEVSQQNNPSDLLEGYKQLSELYNTKKQYDSAYKYLHDFVVLKDSLHDLTKITEAQNFAFNQTLIDQQVEQAKKEARQEQETRIKFYALAVVIAFILLAAFFLMRNLRNKRAANILLTKQKEEIQQSLSALKEAQAQLIQAEKMASLGELTAGIAHEIQNPLNFVNNFSEVNKEMVDEAAEEIDKGNIDEVKDILTDIKSNSEKINHHGKRADAIVKGMLQHSRKSEGHKELTDINALADEYLRLSYHGLRAKDKTFNATLKTDFDASIGKINVIPQDIGRVLLNLITNAFYAVGQKKQQTTEDGGQTTDDGRLTTDDGPQTPEKLHEPTVSVTTKKIAGNVEIKVSDNGDGISQNIIDKIFQPFFTTKPTGEGTGLGLSLAYDIVKAHGGELIVESEEGHGSTFIIKLPGNV